MSEAKQLDAASTNGVRVSDVKVAGDPDVWRLLCKASSERQGWMKSTKIMSVAGGVFLQVTTQQRNPDGSYSVAESVTFAPGVDL